jgi:hypothetical protein
MMAMGRVLHLKKQALLVAFSRLGKCGSYEKRRRENQKNAHSLGSRLRGGDASPSNRNSAKNRKCFSPSTGGV